MQKGTEMLTASPDGGFTRFLNHSDFTITLAQRERKLLANLP